MHHHEQRGQAPDAIQAGQPLPRRAGDCRYREWRAPARVHPRAPAGDDARCHLRVTRYEPNALRKRLRKASIGQTGAFGLGRKPALPAPAGNLRPAPPGHGR